MDYPKGMPNVGLVGGKFVDENVSTGLPGSLIPATWGNAVTDELLAVIRAAGLVPSEGNNAQLLAAIQGLAASDVKRAVRVATTGPVALSGLQTIDGVALAAGDRVLVKDQATAAQNWIYTVAAGAWVRALDANENAECTPGHLIIIQAGTSYGGSMWQLVNTLPPQVGTTPLAFNMVFGKSGVAAGGYRQVTVDTLGRVTAGSNPTTAAGYGLTDVYTKTEVDQSLASKAPLNSPKFTGSPEVPAPSSQEWGTQAVNVKYFRDLMHGLAHIDVSGSGDYELTAAQAGKRLIYLGGVLTGNRNIILPGGFNGYTIRNATGGAFKLTVKMAVGVGVEVAPGKIAEVFTDASNTFPCNTDYTALDNAIAAKAALESPTFTGVPKGPTAPAGTNNQQLSTTAFVQTAVGDRLKVGDVSQQRPRLASPTSTDGWDATALEVREVQLVGEWNPAEVGDKWGPGIAFHWAGKYGGKLHMSAVGDLKWNGRPLATTDSPWFTGTPRADTAPGNDDSFQLANTAYVQASIRGQAPKMAKAWINFWGTSTIGIRNSFNVSSIVDNGVGDYTVNFVTPMPNANYAAVTGGALNDSPIAGINCTKAYARTQTGFKIGTTNTTSGSTDFLFVDAVVFAN
ncbi:hypothetical protein [Pseudomonas sp. NMI795_08]|uniref:hypothetical protein n=1 Tax=Pseudomonas sp. NMI795_08 TaxID=2903144 RepID=UPI001E4E70AD|nr:hypothetical protein [Pseudomonas sp. NMI795_08]MCE1119063.1 hypothetical protein [Pseudomonas sp. NMI795_08]